MKRRVFMAGAIIAGLAARASGQTSAATRRLALFAPRVQAETYRQSPQFSALLDALRQKKFAEGDNLKLEIYGKEENAAGRAALAAKVVASKPDVIFVAGGGGPLFQRMTDRIPIVVVSYDLMAQGLVQSLAHPGGNITGVAVDTGPAIWRKRIALLREMAPTVTKLGFLTGPLPGNVSRNVQVPAVANAADAERIDFVVIPVAYPAAEGDYRAALETASRVGADALLAAQHFQTREYAPLLAQLVAAARLPAIYPFRENVEVGGLMAYSEDLADLYRSAGDAIAAILNGERPADIPVQQPSRFSLTINLKTAHTLGLDPPATLLAAADKVIE